MLSGPGPFWLYCCGRGGAVRQLLYRLSYRSMRGLRAGLEPATCRFGSITEMLRPTADLVAVM
jgi:hypothetical protein